MKEGGVWKRVEDTDLGKPLNDDATHIVYTLGCENKRIDINGITFTDYFETDHQELLLKQQDSFDQKISNNKETIGKSDSNVKSRLFEDKKSDENAKIARINTLSSCSTHPHHMHLQIVSGRISKRMLNFRERSI